MTPTTDENAGLATGSPERREVVIFGGRGGGAIVAHYLHNIAAAHGMLCPRGFLNDREVPGTTIAGIPVLGPFAAWRDQPERTLFVAPLHKAKEMPAQVRRIAGLGVPETRWATPLDPLAHIAPDARFGPGSHVGYHATVMPGATIGAHVAVRPGAIVAHDVAVEDYAFIGLNVVVCGYVRVDEGAHLAPGALVKEGLRVGRYAVVGLGAVVLEDVPDYVIMAGNPAREIGRVEAA